MMYVAGVHANAILLQLVNDTIVSEINCNFIVNVKLGSRSGRRNERRTKVWRCICWMLETGTLCISEIDFLTFVSVRSRSQICARIDRRWKRDIVGASR